MGKYTLSIVVFTWPLLALSELKVLEGSSLKSLMARGNHPNRKGILSAHRELCVLGSWLLKWPLQDTEAILGQEVSLLTFWRLECPLVPLGGHITCLSCRDTEPTWVLHCYSSKVDGKTKQSNI